jgi:Ca2+-binding EF-hand superfamily protein
MDKFFAEQEALQDEARQAFRKYDADNSNSIDAEELRAVLADMSFFEGLDEAGQSDLVVGLCTLESS